MLVYGQMRPLPNTLALKSYGVKTDLRAIRYRWLVHLSA